MGKNTRRKIKIGKTKINSRKSGVTYLMIKTTRTKSKK